MFSLAVLQSTEMPRSSQNVTPNYFLISSKQLFPIQYNRALIGDAKQRWLNNKQPPKVSWSDTSSRGNCHRLLFICQLKWKQLDGDILTAQQRSYFFKVATANHRKLERAHRHSLYSSSGASESNLLLQDNRKSEATVGFLSLDFSPLFTCLSTSLSFPRCSRPGSEGFNFLPATKLHCNYTPYFIVLDVDNSLCA